MTAHNRHLFGNMKPVLIQSPGAVAVEAGDLMYIEENQSNQAYPIDECIAPTAGTAQMEHIHTNFLGVAMESKASGVTQHITVATAGVFRFPLGYTSAVTVGARAYAATRTSTVVGPPPQVMKNTSTSQTTAILGIIQKTESGASFVDVRIFSSVNGPILTS